MLDVDGRDHLDARCERVDHVLPPLRALRARDVRVRQLVDQRDLWLAFDQRVDVHLLELAAAVLEELHRDDLEAFEHRDRLLAAVRRHEPDDDVGPSFQPPVPFGEHRVGLADPGGGAEVHPQRSGLPAVGLLLRPGRRDGRLDDVPTRQGLHGLALDREASLLLSHTEMMPDAGRHRSPRLAGVLEIGFGDGSASGRCRCRCRCRGRCHRRCRGTPRSDRDRGSRTRRNRPPTVGRRHRRRRRTSPRAWPCSPAGARASSAGPGCPAGRPGAPRAGRSRCRARSGPRRPRSRRPPTAVIALLDGLDLGAGRPGRTAETRRDRWTRVRPVGPVTSGSCGPRGARREGLAEASEPIAMTAATATIVARHAFHARWRWPRCIR